VRDLLGHTSRSLTTVETYLDLDGSGPVELLDAVAYTWLSPSPSLSLSPAPWPTPPQ